MKRAQQSNFDIVRGELCVIFIYKISMKQMKRLINLSVLSLMMIVAFSSCKSSKISSANPILPDFQADPSARVFGKKRFGREYRMGYGGLACFFEFRFNKLER